MPGKIDFFIATSPQNNACTYGCKSAALPASMHLSSDCKEFLALLHSEKVDFLVVGAMALAAHGRPRYSGDVDLWIRCDEETALKMVRVIERFGFASTGLSKDDFATPDLVVQLGIAPNRIDILTGLTGLDFSSTWDARVTLEMDGIPLPFIDKASFIENKRAIGRAKDIADIDELED